VVGGGDENSAGRRVGWIASRQVQNDNQST
jgi:hypothetical protein